MAPAALGVRLQEELIRFDAELPGSKTAHVSRPWDLQNWPAKSGARTDVLRKYADHWELDATNTRRTVRTSDMMPTAGDS